MGFASKGKSMLSLISNDVVAWRGRDVITYVDINLFESPAQTLVNTVNTVGVMGKGIAAVFKRLYPEMFQKYRQICQQRKLEIGKLYVYRTPNKIIVNFPTKKHWRNPSEISYIESGLAKFVSVYQDYGISSVAFPQLGCGHGELNWENEVQPLMEHYLQKLPIPVYIHIYTKSPDFVPERLDNEFARQMRLERQQISANQVWEDLNKIITSSDNNQYHIDLLTTVKMDDEHLFFNYFNCQNSIIYRQDVEDLWNVLRLRGTLREDDFPQQINEQLVAPCLLELLKQLPYIKPISLGLRQGGAISKVQGIQYAPSSIENWAKDSEIVL
jgi:O-acetyl-ADP-ribose deacetylase (regulator of RNase III)